MNKFEEKYPNLSQIMECYFHENYDLFGEDMGEIISYHKNNVDRQRVEDEVNDIVRFESENKNNLEFVFEREFEGQFNPELWGHTATSFLAELKRLLSE